MEDSLGVTEGGDESEEICGDQTTQEEDNQS